MSLLNRPKSHESVIADVAALGVQRYCPECGKVHLPPKKPITPQIMPRSRGRSPKNPERSERLKHETEERA